MGRNPSTISDQKGNSSLGVLLKTCHLKRQKKSLGKQAEGWHSWAWGWHSRVNKLQRALPVTVMYSALMQCAHHNCKHLAGPGGATCTPFIIPWVSIKLQSAQSQYSQEANFWVHNRQHKTPQHTPLPAESLHRAPEAGVSCSPIPMETAPVANNWWVTVWKTPVIKKYLVLVRLEWVFCAHLFLNFA